MNLVGWDPVRRQWARGWDCWETQTTTRHRKTARSPGGSVRCPVCHNPLVLVKCRPVGFWQVDVAEGRRRAYGRAS